MKFEIQALATRLYIIIFLISEILHSFKLQLILKCSLEINLYQFFKLKLHTVVVYYLNKHINGL